MKDRYNYGQCYCVVDKNKKGILQIGQIRSVSNCALLSQNSNAVNPNAKLIA